MGTLAAAMTGKGAGAIATIALYGPDGLAIIKKVFKPKVSSDTPLDAGGLVLGEIHDENDVIDEVLIGYEHPDYLAVNCHGNPLIVTDIMRLLHKYGAAPVTAERMLAELPLRGGQSNTIAVEAKLAVAQAKTLEATRSIVYQGDKGLNRAAEDWLERANTSELTPIQAQAKDILERSTPAKPLLFGAKIVLAGPPNSGKSTLLNCLAGKQKAIIAELKGTTRDWVSAECILGRIYAELIDTAGIDDRLLSNGEAIEKIAQQKAKELLAAADLILLVLDASVQAQESLRFFAEILAGKKVLTVLNKVDLPVKFDRSTLPEILKNTVQTSAKFGTGCEELIHSIEQMLAAAQFDYKKPICFTDRQEQLLRQIAAAKSKEDTVSVISQLLNGRPRV